MKTVITLCGPVSPAFGAHTMRRYASELCLEALRLILGGGDASALLDDVLDIMAQADEFCRGDGS